MTRSDLFELASRDGRVHLGDLQDGTPVFSKKGVSHVASHGSVEELLPEALALVPNEFDGRNLGRNVNLHRVLGTSSCVETGESDEIVYARRTGRKDGCSRFVLRREPIACSTVAVRLFLNDEGLIALMTAYIGVLAPAEPCSPSGRTDAATWQASCDFWRTRALVWDGNVETESFTDTDFFGAPV